MNSLKLVLEWRKDWTGERDPKAIRTRLAVLRGCKPTDMELLSNRVREARDGRALLAKELAWPIYDELHMIGSVFATSNPLDLLELADIAGSDRLIVQQRFEALCLTDLAIAMYQLERIDSMNRVEEDMRGMIDLLQRRIFSGTTRDLDIYTYHDAQDMFRVKGVSYDVSGEFPNLVQRKHNSLCRVTKEGIVLRFDVRPKDRFRTVVKLVKQLNAPKEGQDPYLVKDRCGFKFVVQSTEDAIALAEELEWFLVASGADVKSDGDNLTVETGVGADVTNPHTSPNYRKKQLAVHWHGRWYEFQIVLFSGYYSAQYALDDENHTVYKLRQGMKDILPMLYPGKIFLEEKTWESDALQKMLLERQLENLGWWHQRKQRNGVIKHS